MNTDYQKEMNKMKSKRKNFNFLMNVLLYCIPVGIGIFLIGLSN